MGKNRNLTRIFLIGSILFSFLLYFFIIKGLLGAQNLSFTPSNLATLHQNPIYFLIDSLVIILPLFAWLVGSFFEELVNSLRK
jgi:hypothetical protein